MIWLCQDLKETFKIPVAKILTSRPVRLWIDGTQIHSLAAHPHLPSHVSSIPVPCLTFFSVLMPC